MSEEDDLDERSRWTLAAAARWIHTYLSLAGFGALFFFAITGLTLNHAEWFEEGGERVRSWTVEVPRDMLAAEPEPDYEAIAAWLRREHGVRGELHDWSTDAERLWLAMKGPGRSVDADIELESAKAVVREHWLNAWAVMDDFHKGRDTGMAWSWVIDISALVMALSSLTGLWLLFHVRKRRNPGLLVALVGLVALVATALVFAP